MANYYLRDKTGERGPYTPGQLRAMWGNGSVTADAEFRAEGETTWNRMASAQESTVVPPRIAGSESLPPKAKKRTSGASKVVISLLVIAFFVVLLALSPDSKQEPSKTMRIEVSWGAYVVSIRNVGTPEIAGKQITIYLNDTPPFTYKAQAVGPEVGESVVVPLNSFIKRDGTRFNPETLAVVQAWVGGGEFDYVQYK